MKGWILGSALVAVSLFCGGVLLVSPVPASAGLVTFDLSNCVEAWRKLGES
jgi:hypothetical protein